MGEEGLQLWPLPSLPLKMPSSLTSQPATNGDVFTMLNLGTAWIIFRMQVSTAHPNTTPVIDCCWVEGSPGCWPHDVPKPTASRLHVLLNS